MVRVAKYVAGAVAQNAEHILKVAKCPSVQRAAIDLGVAVKAAW